MNTLLLALMKYFGLISPILGSRLEHVLRQHTCHRRSFLVILVLVLAFNGFAQEPSVRFIDVAGKTLAEVPFLLHDERVYLPVDTVKAVFGQESTTQYNLPRKRLTLKIKGRQLRLQMEKSTVSIDGGERRLPLSEPPRVIQGQPMLPIAFFIEVFPELDDVDVLYNPNLRRLRLMPKHISESSEKDASQKWVVIIDPGHGGAGDRGHESNTGIFEKDVALEFAQQCLTASKQQGFQLHLTRDRDTKTTQLERIQIANRHQAQLFISLHCNASFSSKASGIRIYLNNPNGKLRFPKAENLMLTGKRLQTLIQANFLRQSQEFAQILQKELSFLTENPVMIEQLPLIALSKAYMPAVLVELGYLTHTKDLARLSNPEYSREIAKAIVRAVQTYLASIPRESATAVPR